MLTDLAAAVVRLEVGEREQERGAFDGGEAAVQRGFGERAEQAEPAGVDLTRPVLDGYAGRRRACVEWVDPGREATTERDWLVADEPITH